MDSVSHFQPHDLSLLLLPQYNFLYTVYVQVYTNSSMDPIVETHARRSSKLHTFDYFRMSVGSDCFCRLFILGTSNYFCVKQIILELFEIGILVVVLTFAEMEFSKVN